MINVSFGNTPIMFRTKLMKKYIHISIQVAYHLSDENNTLNNIHKDFVIVPKDKATGNVILV